MVTARSVDRRPYRTTPLTSAQKAALAAALGADLELRWFETPPERRQIARLNGWATDIRLRIPEAYRVHQADPRLGARLQPRRRAGSGGRAQSAGGAGDALADARLEADGRRQSLFRHDVVVAARARPGARAFRRRAFRRAAEASGHLDDPAATLRIGQALQRFWLTATQLGLVMQPALATICFALYGMQGRVFTQDAGILRKAEALARALAEAVPGGAPAIAFIGRIGEPRSRRIQARSVRRPLSELMQREEAGAETVNPAKTGT